MERSKLITGAVLAITTTSLLAARASAAPVLVNGSFEAPAYAPGTITSNTGGQGWVKSFMSSVNIISGNAVVGDGRSLGTTPFGTQYLGLDPRVGNSFVARDSQEVDGFEAGVTYELAAYFADALGGSDPTLGLTIFDPAPADPLSDGILFNQTFTAPIAGPYGTGVIPFTRATLTFTPAVSGTLGVQVYNASGAFAAGTAISVDNVTLAAVPEPTAAGLTLLGAGLLACRRRRA